MASGRRQYPFHLIEPKWQRVWEDQQTFKAFNPGETVPAEHPFAARHGLAGKKPSASELPPKFYILDMFPYPSGAGLHVGHPEGYTATDILARYKRAQGFHVLHPMGWDAFGLPAEQYAVKTGQHPRQTTEQNIATFKRQIKSLGFSYDWSRELATTDPDYFKWTQWIFLKLYNSWFNKATNKAEPISWLEDALSENPKGLSGQNDYAHLSNVRDLFWTKIPPETRQEIRTRFIEYERLAYVSEAPVNWCPELGTVLANEEVIDGKSEVGGFPVVRKPMRQWMLRITAYAERLLADLDTIDWSDSLKEMQRNWIGRSEGAEVNFEVAGLQGADLEAKRACALMAKKSSLVSLEGKRAAAKKIRVFTTRPDTLFGATYLVLAPEHPLIAQWLNQFDDEWPKLRQTSGGDVEQLLLQTGLSDLIATVPIEWSPNTRREWTFDSATPREAIASYRAFAAAKSDLERTDLAKEKTGVFTGAYAINPVNDQKIPIWIADYVLASYGTGAIMAVPAHDRRDFEFARRFKLPIRSVVARIETSRMLGADEKAAFHVITLPVGEHGKVAYFSHDVCDEGEGYAVNSANQTISLNCLPTAKAKKKITDWLEAKGLGKRTINYKLRDWLFSRQRYWGEPFPIVWKRDASGNLYHEALPESALPVLPPALTDYKPTATGEPPLARAKDWVNLPDGSTRETNTMPQWAGSCWYYLRYLDAKNAQSFVGKEAEQYWMNSVAADGSPPQKPGGALPIAATRQGVDLYVGGTEHAVLHLLYARFWHKVLFDLGYVSTPEPFFKLVNQGLILGEDGQKMSKSRGNVVNPDDILNEYGADAFRLYEMFMGPLQDSKPWSTRSVEGVYRFLGRVWRLFVDEKSETEFEQAETTANTQVPEQLLNLIKLDARIQDTTPTPVQLKTLHACIKKVTEDLDGMRFNTAISAMMEFVNAALHWEAKPFSVMREFLILLQPFAPHVAEELWDKLASAFSLQPSALSYALWPKFDPAFLVESEIEIPVQVNGKLRDVIRVPADADNAALEHAALASEKVQQFIAGKTIKKVIVVPKKLVNIAVG